jgi:hypothetical protein
MIKIYSAYSFLKDYQTLAYPQGFIILTYTITYVTIYKNKKYDNSYSNNDRKKDLHPNSKN